MVEWGCVSGEHDKQLLCTTYDDRLVSRLQVCPFRPLIDSDLPEMVPRGEEAPRSHIVCLLSDRTPGSSGVAGRRRRLGASRGTVSVVTPPCAGQQLELGRLRLPLSKLVSWRWCWSLARCRYRCWVALAGPRPRRHCWSLARRRCLVLERESRSWVRRRCRYRTASGARRGAAAGASQQLRTWRDGTAGTLYGGRSWGSSGLGRSVSGEATVTPEGAGCGSRSSGCSTLASCRSSCSGCNVLPSWRKGDHSRMLSAVARGTATAAPRYRAGGAAAAGGQRR